MKRQFPKPHPAGHGVAPKLSLPAPGPSWREEARRRHLAGWTQSVAGGFPDVPPSGITYERYVDRVFSAIQADMDDKAQRRRDEVLSRVLAWALFAIGVICLLAMGWLEFKGG